MVRIGTRRLLAVLAGVILASTFVAGSASAETTIAFEATFPERFGGPQHSPFTCPDPPSLCSQGEVVGLGHATEIIRFNECGANCNLRTLTFANGSTLVLQESTGPGVPPDDGNSFNPNSYGNPIFFTLAGAVRGDLSTGDFAGATGSYTGNVVVAGGVAVVRLSGSITRAS